MNEFEKLPIFFVTIETLIHTYQENEAITFKNLGVISGSKFILSQVLYLKKKVTKNPYLILVDKSTFVQKRVPIIRYMIEELIIKKYQLGKKEATIYASLGYLVVFINWLDTQMIEYCTTTQEAQKIFLDYSYHLKMSIQNHILTQGSAHIYQYAALKMLQYLLNDTENKISSIAPLIKNIRDFTIEKSLDTNMKYHFNFYYKFFHGVSNFILGHGHYPLRLSLVSSDIWVLPSPFTYVTQQTTKAHKSFNRVTGEAYTIEEMEKLYTLTKSEAKKRLYDYESNLKKHNTHFKTYHRVRLASMALKAYYMLFLSVTGMNDSTATTLLWNDAFEIEKEMYKFHNIKYRAGNKIVEFQIQKKCLKDFQKYLQLRNYLLDKHDSPFLFFSSTKSANLIPFRNQVGSFSSCITREMQRNIDRKLPTINSRQLRVNKTYQIIHNSGILAASQLAQSSLSTIISFYQGESFESSSRQLTEYFEQLNKNIFAINTHCVETRMGYCNSYNTPKSQITFANNPIECRQPEGCLFCESYAIHGDKNDFQKIYSLQYIILESKFITKNIEHFESIYTQVLQRIDTICNEAVLLKRISQEALTQVKDDVFVKQNLHPYWEHKLNSLISMGVLK